MSDPLFTITVRQGVENVPMNGVNQYQLASRIDTLREWFDLNPDDFEITVDKFAPEPGGTND